MNFSAPSSSVPGQSTLRRAALVAGLAYLLMPVACAEFAIYPKLEIPGNIDQTVQNISTHGRLFAVAIFCYS